MPRPKVWVSGEPTPSNIAAMPSTSRHSAPRAGSTSARASTNRALAAPSAPSRRRRDQVHRSGRIASRMMPQDRRVAAAGGNNGRAAGLASVGLQIGIIGARRLGTHGGLAAVAAPRRASCSSGSPGSAGTRTRTTSTAGGRHGAGRHRLHGLQRAHLPPLRRDARRRSGVESRPSDMSFSVRATGATSSTPASACAGSSPSPRRAFTTRTCRCSPTSLRFFRAGRRALADGRRPRSRSGEFLERAIASATRSCATSCCRWAAPSGRRRRATMRAFPADVLPALPRQPRPAGGVGPARLAHDRRRQPVVRATRIAAHLGRRRARRPRRCVR